MYFGGWGVFAFVSVLDSIVLSADSMSIRININDGCLYLLCGNCLFQFYSPQATGNPFVLLGKYLSINPNLPRSVVM